MIELKNVTKTYGQTTVLEDMNVCINDKEITAIVGASGSGKSTLLNILGLLDKEYKGRVTLDGLDITKLKKAARRKFIRDNISYLFQNYALIEQDSIQENLLLALVYTPLSKKEKIQKMKEVLETVQIKHDLKTKVHTLSGGEQQRIAFARTLLKPSKFILADEPTGNLDEKNKNQILSLLFLLKKEGKTVILVTHDNELATSCDRIIQLSSEHVA